MNPDHIAWCKNVFASLSNGGVWGVPRSGLIFTKQGDSLVCTGLMPSTENVDPMADFEAIKAHFGAAGINVRFSKES